MTVWYAQINMKSKKILLHLEIGQTLIETVIAIFILVSGISAVVGLAVFAFSSSQNVSKQLVAVGLAREGIEAVKNIRDLNWLRQITINNNCYNPKTGNNDAYCYANWQSQAVNINPVGLPACSLPTRNGLPNASGGSCQAYRLRFDLGGLFWDLENAANNRFGLNFNSSTSLPSFLGYYDFPNSAGVDHTNASSDYARQIVIIEDNGVPQYGSGANNPFNKAVTGVRLLVVSRVWWADKKCPRSNGWPGLGRCSVEIRTYLTNWKNYDIP